eukprot:CAMPEP_0197878822 /NCGR_PEP_ID=MMETSP1439-20131203/7082_1 /TAXON_ID=66791 /ORGANISM="Gonyaulax spinifera, Strain CCMP409" /LENGTH=613 /DNA_ID=CAMNT_0043498275 /DNA_START=68 /DNA_END=1909 /DNA_ORIENTATION=-
MALLWSLRAFGLAVFASAGRSNPGVPDDLAYFQRSVAVRSDLQVDTAAAPGKGLKHTQEPKGAAASKPAGAGVVNSEALKTYGSIIQGLMHLTAKKKVQNGEVVHRAKARPVKQTEAERKQEPLTRAVLHDNLLWLLRQMPLVPAAMRGSMVGYAVQEVMSVRRTTHPQVRVLMDHLFTIDISDIAMETLHSKATAVVQALHSAGYRRAANTLNIALPVARLIKYFGKESLSHMTINTTASLLRDVAEVIPEKTKETHSFILDLADVLEGNAGRHMRAHELLEGMEGKADASRWLPVVADSIFTVRDMANHSVGEYLLTDVGQILRDLSIGHLSLAPVGALVEDIPRLAAANVSATTAVKRIAQLINDFEVLNSTHMSFAFNAMDGGRDKANELLSNSSKDLKDYSDEFNSVVSTGLHNATISFDEFAKVAKVKVEEFGPEVNIGFHNLTIALDEFMKVAKVKVEEYAREAVIQVNKFLSNSTVWFEGFTNNATVAAQALTKNATVAYNEFVDVAKSVVDSAINATSYFACHLRGADEVRQQCGPLLVNDGHEAFGNAPAQSLLSIDATLDTTSMDADEMAGEEVGRQLQGLVAALRGEEVDTSYTVESSEVS